MPNVQLEQSVSAGGFLIVGGAGFIGSHFVDALLSDPLCPRVVVYDNFSSGREWHYEAHVRDNRLKIVRGDVEDTARLAEAIEGCSTVIHLASNPDIAAAMADPSIDFHQGTALTHSVVEACRQSSCQTILYASGSGVYGDLGEFEVHEAFGPMTPVSTYGASKLAGEALVASYCHMFSMRGRSFRFGNVVGPRQTHGVGFDFVRRLMSEPARLQILGDGTQSKSYVHVGDVVNAVLTLGTTTSNTSIYDVYNIATGDYITVAEIALIATRLMGLEDVEFTYGNTPKGWAGDVPIIRINIDKAVKAGWRPLMNSAQAISSSLTQLLPDARRGRF